MIDTLVSALGVISVAVWIIVILRLYFTSVPEENKPRKIEHDECPICIEVYDNETLLTCGHAFCGRCILDYLSRFSSNATCPLCRNNITKLFVNFEANNDESREME